MVVEQFNEQGARLPSLTVTQLGTALNTLVTDSMGYLFAVDKSPGLRKIAPSGKQLWVYSLDASAPQSLQLSTTTDGACYLAGTISGSLSLGSTKLSKTSGVDGFITRIDSSPFGISKTPTAAVISWPVLPRANLESSANLAVPQWTLIDRASSVIEDRNVIVEAAAEPERFYRLRLE